MLNLKFEYIRAKNFLCFGPDGIEIDLTKRGNIILVRGDNQDVKDEEERIASNGVGKSSIPEIIVYTLFGKTIKSKTKINHDNVINNRSAKKLETEVRWGNFRVVRGRKPNFLRLWESAEHIWDDNTEISLGGMPETEREIEKKLGLNYETFINTVVFTDNNAGAFLECDTPSKRKIVENLLSLDKYTEFFESAKKTRNEAKEKVEDITREYQRCLDDIASCKKRIDVVVAQEEDWRNKKTTELKALTTRIELKRHELESSDIGAALSRYNDAQDKIATLNASLPDLTAKGTRVKQILQEATDKLNEIKQQIHTINLEITTETQLIETCQSEIAKAENDITSLETKAGSECPVCHGTVEPENYGTFVRHTRECILRSKNKITTLEKSIADKTEMLTGFKGDSSKLQATISAAVGKQQELVNKATQVKKEIQEHSKVQKPEALSHEKILEDQVEELKNQVVRLKEEIDGVSPFAAIHKIAVAEQQAKEHDSKAKKAELEVAEKDLPYYEFWVKAFGDKGIRKFVIDGIIPALNSRIAYWLQFLIDGRIKLTFNNQLEETIERNPPDGDPFVYYAMSGGERRRLNLAVSQSFAYVMMLNSGVSPSLVFLDEVTTNIDPMGVQGVFNMICELAKEKQVFVTTHDHDLLEMLSGYEQISLVKKDGFTKLM